MNSVDANGLIIRIYIMRSDWWWWWWWWW